MDKLVQMVQQKLGGLEGALVAGGMKGNADFVRQARCRRVLTRMPRRRGACRVGSRRRLTAMTGKLANATEAEKSERRYQSGMSLWNPNGSGFAAGPDPVSDATPLPSFRRQAGLPFPSGNHRQYWSGRAIGGHQHCWLLAKGSGRKRTCHRTLVKTACSATTVQLLAGARRDSVRNPANKGQVAPMASKPATKAKPVAAPKTAAKKPAKPIATAKALAPSSAAKKPAAKATRMAAPKKAGETVTLKTVFEQLAAGHDLPKKLGQTLLTDFVTSVTSILKHGDRLRMSGLGIIEVKDRPARMGRNPATGAAVQIAASKKVAFRAAKELKAAV